VTCNRFAPTAHPRKPSRPAGVKAPGLRCDVDGMGNRALHPPPLPSPIDNAKPGRGQDVGGPIGSPMPSGPNSLAKLGATPLRVFFPLLTLHIWTTKIGHLDCKLQSIHLIHLFILLHSNPQGTDATNMGSHSMAVPPWLFSLLSAMSKHFIWLSNGF